MVKNEKEQTTIINGNRSQYLHQRRDWTRMCVMVDQISREFRVKPLQPNSLSTKFSVLHVSFTCGESLDVPGLKIEKSIWKENNPYVFSRNS